MHELSLLRDLINKITTIAHQEKADKVTKVKVELGALAHISADHFKEHFIEAVEGTIAQYAELEIIENPDPNHPKAQDITLLSIDVHDS